MIQRILQFIAPDNCIKCHSEGALLCEWCRLNMETVPSRCFYCHKMTDDFNVCVKCKPKSGIKKLYVADEYKDEAKELVSALKFRSKRQASLPIARIMAEQLPFLDKDSVIVNLPTAPQRVRQRGFDHTLYIAKEIAKLKDLNVASVLRRKDNKRQVGSTRKKRLEQLKDSYRIIRPEKIKDKTIILIDDVVTTGASLDSAIKVLKQAGAKQVYAAVFAYNK